MSPEAKLLASTIAYTISMAERIRNSPEAQEEMLRVLNNNQKAVDYMISRTPEQIASELEQEYIHARGALPADYVREI